MTTLFSGASGLNTKLDPVRIRFNPKGVSDLSLAVNVWIDDTGRISRRKGSTRVTTGAWHSLHDCGRYALGVTGDALTVIKTDYSTSAIRKVTENARMTYETDFDWTFYANGFEIGYVKDMVSYPWTKPSAYLGQDSEAVWIDPPIGHIVSRYKARMLIAVDKYLYASRAQDFFRFNEVYYPFPDRIKMVKPVQTGVFVGTAEETYFLRGDISTTALVPFEKIKIADYGVVEGTDLIIPGTRVGEGMGNEVAIWTAIGRGVCIGTPDGQFINITERKISLPECQYGTAIYRDGAYIVLLEP